MHVPFRRARRTLAPHSLPTDCNEPQESLPLEVTRSWVARDSLPAATGSATVIDQNCQFGAKLRISTATLQGEVNRALEHGPQATV